MSYPRPVYPGATVMVTRRCSQRQLLLRPGTETNQIFEFCLAHAALLSGIQLHAYCVLSNHYHIVLTDPEGRLPVFMHWLDTYVAKCMNVSLDRWESFWAPGSYSVVRAVDAEAVVARLVYTWANPVDAGLVRTAREWPGTQSLPEDLGVEGRVISRPEGFFRKRGKVPEEVTLRVVIPPAFTGRSVEDVRQELARRLDEREREIRDSMRAKGRSFLGRRRVLLQSPFAKPSTRETRRGLNPQVASRDKWRRMDAILQIKGFLSSYRDALARWIGGDRSARFPPGTYQMRVLFKVDIDWDAEPVGV